MKVWLMNCMIEKEALYHLVCSPGSVAVYSVNEKSGKPMYQSTAKTGKHTDPVWQVRLLGCIN